jgi:hypothetical protein
MYIHIYLHIYTYLYILYNRLPTRCVCVCVCVCVCMCVCVCVCVCVCLCVCVIWKELLLCILIKFFFCLHNIIMYVIIIGKQKCIECDEFKNLLDEKRTQ